MLSLETPVPVVCLMGPTSVGKTRLSCALHARMATEIVSVDSKLVYRGMDIGTAKPSAADRRRIPHHLIDIKDPTESYSAEAFCLDASNRIERIRWNRRIPLLVGGTMFYFRSLLQGLSSLPPRNPRVRHWIECEANKPQGSLHRLLRTVDPPSADRIHPHDAQRIVRALEVFFVSGKTLTEWFVLPRKILRHRVLCFVVLPYDLCSLRRSIRNRFHRMLDSGFEHEAYRLFRRGDLHVGLPSVQCIGYRQMWSYFSNRIGYAAMVEEGIRATQRYAKHQMTWLKKWKHAFVLRHRDPQASVDKIKKVVESVLTKPARSVLLR